MSDGKNPRDTGVAFIGVASFIAMFASALIGIWTRDARWFATAIVALVLFVWMGVSSLRKDDE